MGITLTKAELVELIGLAVPAPEGAIGGRVRFRVRGGGDDVDVTAEVEWEMPEVPPPVLRLIKGGA